MKSEQIKGIGKACRILRISRSTLHYCSIKNDIEFINRLEALTIKHPLEGFWKYHGRLRNQGVHVNHKRLHRIYKQMGLPQRRKCKKRLPARVKEPLVVPTNFTQTWSIDFMNDALNNNRKFRTFNVIDDYNREVLFIEADYSIKSSRVIYILKHLINRYGKPQVIRMDNGPVFISKLITLWSEVNEITFKHIQPGKPMQNAYIERFNKSYRGAVLDAYVFETLDDVREVTQDWVEDYNNHRPHDALDGLSPKMYRIKNQHSSVRNEAKA